MTELMVRRGRGRPPRSHSDGHVTRSVIVRRGTEMMTETGFFSTSIDQLLTTAGIPKGSFYHYFSSKEDFGLAVALLRKSGYVRSSPFPLQTYPARSVRGVPRAVKRFRMAALI